MKPLVPKRVRIAVEVAYASSRLVEVAQAYGSEGWSRRWNPDIQTVDYVKHLPIGIDLVIEHVEELVTGAPDDVSPAVFEVAAQH